MGVSINGGTLKWRVYMEHPIRQNKWMIWGYPHEWTHPYNYHISSLSLHVLNFAIWSIGIAFDHFTSVFRGASELPMLHQGTFAA